MTTKTWTLHRKGGVPMEVTGERLLLGDPASAPTISGHLHTGVHLIRSVSGRMILYIGTYGAQTTFTTPQQVHLDVDRMNTPGIIDLFGGRFDYAEDVLKALGRPLTEKIE